MEQERLKLLEMVWMDICKYVIENREDVKIISKNGKKVFKKIFSMDSFKNRLLEALDEASNFVV